MGSNVVSENVNVLDDDEDELIAYQRAMSNALLNYD